MKTSTKYALAGLAGLGVVGLGFKQYLDREEELKQDETAISAEIQSDQGELDALENKLESCFENNPSIKECRLNFYKYKIKKEEQVILGEEYKAVVENNKSDPELTVYFFGMMGSLFLGALAFASASKKYQIEKQSTGEQ